MIFVILGISVLVASFLIALFSLAREQGRLIEEAKRDEAESKSSLGGPKAKKKVILQQDEKPTAGVVLDQKVAVEDATRPAINRPLFPWEEGKYQAGGNITDADRVKVEALRAQLAELKSRVAAKSPGEDEVKVQAVKPVVRQEEQRLSGEISIADLKRQ